MAKAKKFQLWCAGLAILLCFGCFNSVNTGTGTEIPNELTGLIVGKDGKPVANAKVALYPVSYVPGDTSSTSASKFTTTTDSKGRYTVAKISAGQYNILGSKDSLFSFSDSVSIIDSSGALPTDTLKAPGSLTGKVQLQPQDNPRSATVQVLGTDNYTNVDSLGNFSLTALAEGGYRLRVVTSLPLYTPLYKEVTVHAGKNDTLPQPLIPFYTGIPVVTGTKAILDTVDGIAKLNWNAVSYSGFLGYLVYRDVAGSSNFSQIPINNFRVTDTFYSDTLYRSPPDTVAHAWEYRIRVQDVNGKVGDPFASATLNAVPPRTVQTAIQMQVLGNHHDSASIKDTVRIVASYANPTYANKRVVWFVSGATDTLRIQNVSGKSGSDTLVWIAPDTVVARTFSIRMVDGAGREWKDSIGLTVVLDRPLANAGTDTSVSYGTSFTLHGKGSDGFGRVVEWEWDIGTTGAFVRTSSGDTNFTLPSAADSNYRCVLRVTDDDGVAGVDTVRLNVVPSRLIGTTNLVTYGSQSANAFTWQGKIILVNNNGGVQILSHDTGTGKDTILSSYPWSGSFASGMLDSKVYIMGGLKTTGLDSSVATYDLSTGIWASAPAMPLRFRSGIAIASQGKLYVIANDYFAFFNDPSSGVPVLEFNPMNGIWTQKASVPGQFLTDMAVSENGGKIYLAGGVFNSRLISNSFQEYDPASNTWTSLPSMLNVKEDLGLGWVNGKLYACGGDLSPITNNPKVLDEVDVYDPISGSWKTTYSLLFPRTEFFYTVVGSKIFVIGGFNGNNDTMNSVEAYQP